MSHPNVITIFDLGVLDDGRAYISMEYVDGGDLEGLMRQPMTEKQVVGMLRSLAEALSYVHEHGVIHRDIKPANILLRADNSLVLTDFGVARHEEQDQRFTRDGQAVGSPGYMSPEQAQALALDNRTDLYSVGVIFTEMLLGVNPYIADSFVQTSLNHLQMPVPDLPMEICQYQMLLEKMLAKKSDKRFKDAAMLIRFIDALEEPADVLLPRYSDDEAAQKAFEELRRPLSHPQANAKTSSPSMRASGIQEIQASLEEEPDLSSDKLYSSSGNWLTILIFSLLIGGAGYGYYFHYEVSVLLERGDKAIAAKRLLVPEGDNAFYYFDTVLKRAPDNAQAKQGMQQIADKYYTLAAKALKAKRTQRAQQMLTRGLKVSPEHAGLLKLQKRLKR